MNPRFVLAIAFALLSHWSTAFAQIAVEKEIQPGKLIVATYAADPPPGATAKYDWTWSEGIDARVVDGGRGLYGAALSGEYKIGVDAQFTIKVFTPDPAFPEDPTKAKLTDLPLPPYKFQETITILGERPVPVVQPLAELAGPDAQKLGTLYERLALQATSITTAPSFKAVHAKLLADQGLTNNGAAAAIDKRLAPVLAPFDSTKLKTVLEEFVAELGSLPPPPGPDSPATAATYIYEKDNTAVPVGVSTGLNRLNREKNIRATLFEEDTVDGDGDVPDQYKVPLDAATKAGLPALVVTAGDTVLKVVKDPRTEQQVFEAIAL